VQLVASVQVEHYCKHLTQTLLVAK